MMSPSLKDVLKALSILAAIVVSVVCVDAWLASNDGAHSGGNGAAFLAGASTLQPKG